MGSLRNNALIAIVTSVLLAASLFGCSGEQPSQSGSNGSSVPSEDAHQIELPDTSSEEQGDAEGMSESVAETSSSSESGAANPSSSGISYDLSFLEDLDDVQGRSIAMLNFLMVKTEEINRSSSSRLSLENIYSTLLNNTNKGSVDELTLDQIEQLLDALEGFRMLDVKRERIDFIFEQEKAGAIWAAVPHPLDVTNILSSEALNLSPVSLVGTGAFLVTDAAANYQNAQMQASLDYLNSGWDLDDAGAALLHECRSNAFSYAVKVIKQYGLPNDLVLTESAITQLVEWSNSDNNYARIQFLESNLHVYRAYGGFWLILSQSYYQAHDYAKCVEAFRVYELVQADIFIRDYDYMRTIPYALAAASEIMNNEEYVAFAEPLLRYLVDTCDYPDWDLRYFAAYSLVDLASRTGDRSYLELAYKAVSDNVNYLAGVQQQLNKDYLAPIAKVPVPNDATKQQKDDIKQYNKLLEEDRKVGLPPVYEPLRLNLDLLFALIEDLESSDSLTADQLNRMQGILHPGGKPLFLVSAIDEQYWITDSPAQSVNTELISFDGTHLVLPANYVSADSVVTVSVNREVLPGEWTLKKVKRGTENDLFTFEASYENKDAKHEYAAGETVTVTIADSGGAPDVTLEFKVSVEERLGPIPDAVTFELVNR